MQPNQNFVLGKLGFVVIVIIMFEHFDAGIEQEQAEDIQYPLEFAHQYGADKHHNRPQDNGTEHTVEQYAVLVLRWYFEIAENHQEHKKVVDRQRFFQHIAGEVFHHFLAGKLMPHCLVVADFPIQPTAESAGYGYPHDRPSQRFFGADFMGAAFFQRQHVDGNHD